MDDIFILTSARKAILANLAAFGRHFCQDDINEMVGMTIERFYIKGRYDSSKSAVQTYVSRIAHNVVYDFIKAVDKEKGFRRYIDPAEMADRFMDDQETDSRMLRRERDLFVDKAVSRLAPRQQMLFKLLMEERPNWEIAVIMGTTAGNVAVEACRMKKKMKALLHDAA